MFKRRMIFSLVYLLIILYSIIRYNVSKNFLITTFIPFLFYLPYILKIKIPITFENIILVFIIFAVLIGSMLNMYSTISSWDIILHTIAGIILSLIPLYIFEYNKIESSNTVKYLIIFFVSMGFASFWEMIEYGCDVFLGANSQKAINEGVVDTMNDICVHALGTIIFITIIIIDNKLFENKLYIKIKKQMYRYDKK